MKTPFTMDTHPLVKKQGPRSDERPPSQPLHDLMGTSQQNPPFANQIGKSRGDGRGDGDRSGSGTRRCTVLPMYAVECFRCSRGSCDEDCSLLRANAESKESFYSSNKSSFFDGLNQVSATYVYGWILPISSRDRGMLFSSTSVFSVQSANNGPFGEVEGVVKSKKGRRLRIKYATPRGALMQKLSAGQSCSADKNVSSQQK